MRNFRKLDVWRRAHVLALDIYRDTASWPNDERFGLTAQVRRAAVSVVSNIAEGAGRSSRKDYARFLDIAGGSVAEIDAQLLIARDLGYLSSDVYGVRADHAEEVRRKCARLRDAVLRDA